MHAIPAPLPNGIQAVFVPALHMGRTITQMYGGENRDKPISYDDLFMTFEKEAFPKPGQNVKLEDPVQPEVAREEPGEKFEIPGF